MYPPVVLGRANQDVTLTSQIEGDGLPRDELELSATDGERTPSVKVIVQTT